MTSISDRINPIIVKEVRQAARSRVFIVMIVLTVLACLLIGLQTLARRRNLGDPSVAEDLFFSLYFCLSVVGFLVVPFVAHRSLAREQEDGAWELLQLTGLGPRRILAGKLASTLVHGGFFTALVLPFLSLAYLKGGVHIANLLGLAAYGMALTGGLSVFTLFTAAVPVTRAGRTGMQLLTLVGLTFALGIGYALAKSMVRDGIFVVGTGLRREDNLFLVVAFVAGLAGGCWVLFEAAVSRLSLATERYARGARLAVAATALGITALDLLWWFVTEDRGPAPLRAAGLTAMLGYAAALGFAADADRPRGRGADEPALLRPGAVWGLRFVVLLLALPSLFWLAISMVFLDGRYAPAIVAAPSYALIFITIPLLACRGLRFRRLASPDMVRAIAIVFLLFCSLLPAAATEIWRGGYSVWAVLPSPFLAIGQMDGSWAAYTDVESTGRELAAQGRHAAAFLAVVALVLTVATDRLLVARARRAR